METTDWDRYGTGNYEKCANCMAHCGYEATAVTDAVRHPLKALRIALRPIETERAMAPEIPLEHQRPADFVFEKHREQAVAELPEREVRRRQRSDAA